MTQKHFIAVANAIRFHNENCGGALEDASSFDAYHLATLADAFREINPRFNKKHWVDYIEGTCGPSGGRIKNAQ